MTDIGNTFNTTAISLGASWKRRMIISRGYNNEIESTEFNNVAQATDIYPSASELMDVVSDSADDTLAGVGCQIIHIVAINEDWKQVEFTLDMNGTTPVELSDDQLIRIVSCSVSQVGANESNQGTITVFKRSDPTAVYSTITLFESTFTNISYDSLISVPVDYKDQIMKINVSCNDNSENITFRLMQKNNTTGVARCLYQGSFNSSITMTFDSFTIEQKCDYWVMAKSLSLSSKRVQAYIESIRSYSPGQ